MDSFADRIRTLADTEIDLIQLRDKRLTELEIGGRIETALEVLSRNTNPPLFILNDIPRLAARFPIDGVHVGQDDACPTETRELVGPEKLVGISTHTFAQATKAIADGADYLGAGPTFPSATKAFHDFPGLAFLEEVSKLPVPLFAIGGIHAQNVGAVLATGVQRIAVSNAIIGADNVVQAVQELNAILR